MALIETRFFSKTLGMCATVNALIPQPANPESAKRAYPVVTLLHGYGQNASAWIRMSMIEALSRQYGVAVIMPDAFLSSYADMAHGLKYQTYLSEELPGIMRGFFPLSDRRADNFLLGCSMGGYGAFRIGLSHPESYSAIGSLSSGHRSIPTFIGRRDDRGFAIADAIFASAGSDPSDDETESRARALANAGTAPKIFVRVGKSDPYTLENCRQARDFFSALPVEFDYAEAEGGHSWTFWNAQLDAFFQFCGLTREEKYL